MKNFSKNWKLSKFLVCLAMVFMTFLTVGWGHNVKNLSWNYAKNQEFGKFGMVKITKKFLGRIPEQSQDHAEFTKF